jgi:protease-4
MALAGCGGENMGFLVKPVSAHQELREAVVADDGLLVANKIALIDVSGMLLNARVGGLFGDNENPASLFCEKLDKARNDSSVKAVVLRLNTPGGTVQASEAMYDYLQRFRRSTGKPVIACITDMGASGGYYLACGCDRILVQSTSITGSIGVIIQTVSFAGTMEWLRISTDAVVSGPFKDMASPLRAMKPQEREMLQQMVNEFYDKFLSVVGQGRKDRLKDDLRKLADGRVYTGRQAVENGLADGLGDVTDACAQARKAAGVSRAKVVMYHRPLGYRASVYSAAPEISPQAGGTTVNLLNLQNSELMTLGRPAFLYLWTTGQ